MARDYKHRAGLSRKQPQPSKISAWKWLLIIILVALFIIFLVFLRRSSPETQTELTTKITKKIQAKKTKSEKQAKKKSSEPHFEFYTLLPNKEVVVQEYELKTRSREESFGKSKSTKYLLQAGSFKDFSEADKLRARLALMGIESKVEKAKVGDTLWNRVKMGPYRRSSSVTLIKKRLRNSGIDAIVIEVKK